MTTTQTTSTIELKAIAEVFTNGEHNADTLRRKLAEIAKLAEIVMSEEK